MSPSRVLQTYEGEEVTVTFDPALCIHSEECVHGLPEVFDPTRKRWIRPDEAPADEVVAAVATWPSGALRASRRGGAAAAASLERPAKRSRLPTPRRSADAGVLPILRTATEATPGSPS